MYYKYDKFFFPIAGNVNYWAFILSLSNRIFQDFTAWPLRVAFTKVFRLYVSIACPAITILTACAQLSITSSMLVILSRPRNISY